MASSFFRQTLNLGTYPNYYSIDGTDSASLYRITQGVPFINFYQIDNLPMPPLKNIYTEHRRLTPFQQDCVTMIDYCNLCIYSAYTNYKSDHDLHTVDYKQLFETLKIPNNALEDLCTLFRKNPSADKHITFMIDEYLKEHPVKDVEPGTKQEFRWYARIWDSLDSVTKFNLLKNYKYTHDKDTYLVYTNKDYKSFVFAYIYWYLYAFVEMVNGILDKNYTFYRSLIIPAEMKGFNHSLAQQLQERFHGKVPPDTKSSISDTCEKNICPSGAEVIYFIFEADIVYGVVDTFIRNGVIPTSISINKYTLESLQEKVIRTRNNPKRKITGTMNPSEFNTFIHNLFDMFTTNMIFLKDADNIGPSISRVEGDYPSDTDALYEPGEEGSIAMIFNINVPTFPEDRRKKQFDQACMKMIDYMNRVYTCWNIFTDTIKSSHPDNTPPYDNTKACLFLKEKFPDKTSIIDQMDNLTCLSNIEAYIISKMHAFSFFLRDILEQVYVPYSNVIHDEHSYLYGKNLIKSLVQLGIEQDIRSASQSTMQSLLGKSDKKIFKLTATAYQVLQDIFKSVIVDDIDNLIEKQMFLPEQISDIKSAYMIVSSSPIPTSTHTGYEPFKDALFIQLIKQRIHDYNDFVVFEMNDRLKLEEETQRKNQLIKALQYVDPAEYAILSSSKPVAPKPAAAEVTNPIHAPAAETKPFDEDAVYNAGRRNKSRKRKQHTTFKYKIKSKRKSHKVKNHRKRKSRR